ncbi:MAG: hypothetical protein O9346_01935 [Leptospiraceae bacterium]|jgi:hypothetical protein|nr:hypothetical protein [Leptospiraceae bacterium]
MSLKKSKSKKDSLPEQEFISKSEFARRLGVARNTIIKAIKEERIREVNEGSNKGKIEFHSQKIEFELNRDSSKDRSSNKEDNSNSESTIQLDPSQASNPNVDPNGKIKLTLTEARKLYLAEQTRQKKLQNDIAERKVVDMQTVEELLFKATRLLRDNTFQIFPRVVPLWAGALQDHVLKSITGKIPEEHLKLIISTISIQDLERISSDLWNKEVTRILEDFSSASKL